MYTSPSPAVQPALFCCTQLVSWVAYRTFEVLHFPRKRLYAGGRKALSPGRVVHLWQSLVSQQAKTLRELVGNKHVLDSHDTEPGSEKPAILRLH